MEPEWTPGLLTPEFRHSPLSAWLMGPSSRLPVQSLASRLKENMEKLTEERDQRTAAENREKEQNKRLQRQLRDTKEEMGELARKEAEASRKKHELVRHPTLGPQAGSSLVGWGGFQRNHGLEN